MDNLPAELVAQLIELIPVGHFLGYYMDTSTPGYIFGAVAISLVSIICIVFTAFFGLKGNDKYAFAPVPPCLRSKFMQMGVLAFRVAAFVLMLTNVSWVFSEKVHPDSEVDLTYNKLILEMIDEVNKVIPGACAEGPNRVVCETGLHGVLDQQTQLMFGKGAVFDSISGYKVWSLGMFTNWNCIMIVIYFIFAILVTCLRLFQPHTMPVIGMGNKAHSTVPVLIEGPAYESRSMFVSVVTKAHMVLAEILLPTALLVTLLIWAYFQPLGTDNGFSSDRTTFDNITSHMMNSILMLVDYSIAGYKFNPRHFVLVVLWQMIYGAFSLILNATCGFIGYPILNTANPQNVFFTISVPMIETFFFFCFVYISLVKELGPREMFKRLKGHHFDTEIQAINDSKDSEANYPQK